MSTSLAESGLFQEAKLIPFGKSWPENMLLPDLSCTLKLSDVPLEGNAAGKSARLTAALTAGDRLARSSYLYQGTFTPQTVQYFGQGNVELTVTPPQSLLPFRETPLKSNPAALQSVSRELSQALIKQLKEQFQKHPETVRLPPEFFPYAAPPEELNWVSDSGGMLLVNGLGFMTGREMIWRFPAPVQTDALLKQLQTTFPEGTVGSDGPKEHRIPRFAYRKKDGEGSVEFFPERDGIWGRREEEIPRDFYLVWSRQMNQKELDAALRELLERGPTEPQLLAVSNVWFLNWEGIEKFFKSHPPRTAETFSKLAGNKASPDRKTRILAANSLALIENDSTLRGSLKSAAKEVGLEELPKQPDVALLVPEFVTDLAQPVISPMTLQPGEQRIFYAGQDEKQICFHLLRPLESTGHQKLRDWEQVNNRLLLGQTQGFGSSKTIGMPVNPLRLSFQVARQEYVRSVRISELSSEQIQLEFGPIEPVETGDDGKL